MIDPTAGAAAAAQFGASPDAAGKDKDSSVEKVFATMMLKEVRKTMPKDGLMGGGANVDAFYDMFDEHVAEEIAASNSLNLSGDGIPRSHAVVRYQACLLYTSPSPRDRG